MVSVCCVCACSRLSHTFSFDWSIHTTNIIQLSRELCVWFLYIACIGCGREHSVETLSTSCVSVFHLYFSRLSQSTPTKPNKSKKKIILDTYTRRTNRMPMTIYYGGCSVLLTKSSDTKIEDINRWTRKMTTTTTTTIKETTHAHEKLSLAIVIVCELVLIKPMNMIGIYDGIIMEISFAITPLCN